MIVCFGAGVFFNRVSNIVKSLGVSYICDNDSRKWGKFIDGIEIRSPESLYDEDKSQLKIIITFQRIDNDFFSQLKKMGMYDCLFFCSSKGELFQVSKGIQYKNIDYTVKFAALNMEIGSMAFYLYADFGIELSSIFSDDPDLIGTELYGIPIYMYDKLNDFRDENFFIISSSCDFFDNDTKKIIREYGLEKNIITCHQIYNIHDFINRKTFHAIHYYHELHDQHYKYIIYLLKYSHTIGSYLKCKNITSISVYSKDITLAHLFAHACYNNVPISRYLTLKSPDESDFTSISNANTMQNEVIVNMDLILSDYEKRKLYHIANINIINYFSEISLKDFLIAEYIEPMDKLQSEQSVSVAVVNLPILPFNSKFPHPSDAVTSDNSLLTSQSERNKKRMYNVLFNGLSVEKKQKYFKKTYTDKEIPWSKDFIGPKQWEDTIYIAGDSRAFGAFAEEGSTIIDVLNNLLIKNGYSYRVKYCYICPSLSHPAEFAPSQHMTVSEFIRSTSFKKGDILVYLCTFDSMKELCGYYKILYCDIASEVLSRDNCFDFFAPDRVHMYANGQEKCAELIFKHIFERNVFHHDSPPHEEVLEKYYDNFSPDLNSLRKADGIDLRNEDLRLFINKLKSLSAPGKIGSIVMNCNPFSLGHFHLIKYASEKVDQLFVFIVEEDLSYFKFEDRIEMVRQATKDIENLTVLPSGRFILSSLTFESYFTKGENVQFTDPSLDILIFCNYIAPALNISIRFAGEEPFDITTRIYNKTMASLLPLYGMEFCVVPRIKEPTEGDVISATKIRRKLIEKDTAGLDKLVPKTTIEYLKKINYL